MNKQFLTGMARGGESLGWPHISISCYPLTLAHEKLKEMHTHAYVSQLTREKGKQDSFFIVFHNKLLRLVAG